MTEFIESLIGVTKPIKNRIISRSNSNVLPELLPLTLADCKTAFFKKIKSPNGKREYKRYMGAPIRYAGGKSLAVGLIVEHIPDNITKIVSPFLGGGSVEIACAVELGLEVIGYDIFDILINYWDVQLKNPNALYERLLEFSPTRKGFKEVKERLKKHWTGERRLRKLDLAAYFYFNHNTSYGPHFLGWPSSVYLQKKHYQKMIEKGKTELAQKTLDKYEKQLNHALQKMEELKQKGEETKNISKNLEDTISKHITVLQQNLQKVPETGKKGIEKALEASSKILERITGNGEEKICENKCGDGICQEIVCMATGCPCAENKDNCSQDCK